MARMGSIVEADRVAWGECDASELLVVEFEGVSGLLNLPIADSRVRGYFREESLDVGSTQFVLGSSRVLREESLHPADAVGDGLVLGTGVSKDSDKILRTLGCRVSWRGYDDRALRHSKTPSKNCYTSKYIINPLQSKKNLRHSKVWPGNKLCYF